MKPGVFRAGGKGERIRFAIGQSSLGSVLVAATDIGVCSIKLGDGPDALLKDLEDQFPSATVEAADPSFESTVGLVIGLIETPGAAADLPLDIRGTAFQCQVWEALRRIPLGRTATYSEIAERIGRPDAVRAVAGACAANRLAVAVPCHRVVRTDGSLSGYRWGVARKEALLKREGAR
jgi:AraC family transcriptional regulator of adaptative response/methylated-DNA-[protein]-cysteine methyltransferase